MVSKDKAGIVEQYVDGLIRDVDLATGLPLPIERGPWAQPFRKNIKSFPNKAKPKSQYQTRGGEIRLDIDGYPIKKKKWKFYKYGKALHDNLAAPEILRLRKQIEREAKQNNASPLQ
jgi:hypothetical protein